MADVISKFLRASGCTVCCAVAMGQFTSCTWREIGCATGGTAAAVSVKLLLDNYNKSRQKRGKSKLSNAEEALIIATATGLGCIIGSEIAGGIEDYTIKKREEYANEAAYLQAHIDDLRASGKEIDKELAWLEEQTASLETQAKNVKKLPALRESMNSKLTEAAGKRQKDVKRVENYLTAARKDASKAYNSTADAEKKAELKKELSAIDARLARTRQVSNSILQSKARVVS